MDAENILGRASQGQINLNVYSRFDASKTNKENNQKRRITRKHLVHMLENDKRYRTSDILYTCYLD